MNKLSHFLLLLSLHLGSHTSSGQHTKADSLYQLLKTNLLDTSRINTLNELGWSFRYKLPDTSVILGLQALQLAEKQKWDKGIASSLRNLGVYSSNKGNYSEASLYYFKALKIYEKIKNKRGIATTIGSIGNLYSDQSDYPKALEYYFKTLSLAQEMGNKNTIATVLGAIGSVYNYLGDSSKAIEYYLRQLKLAEELGKKLEIARALGSVGNIYQDQNKYTKAQSYYLKALKINQDLGNKAGIAIELGNIGNTHKGQGDSASKEGAKQISSQKYSIALYYYLNALKIAKEIGDKYSIALQFGNLGTLYTAMAKFKEGEDYLKQSIEMFYSQHSLNYAKEYENALSNLYTKMGHHELALEHYKKYIALRDTLFSKENTKKSMRTAIQFDFDKREALAIAEHKSEIEKERAVAEEKSRKQKITIWSITVGLLLVIVFSGFITNSWNTTRKQKQIIEVQKLEVENQKELIEEKTKEITDSITYARRLQKAILPRRRDIHAAFPDSFVLFLPKDIVSGDFYWMERLDDDYSGDTDPPFRRKLTHPQYTTIKRTEEAVTKLNRFLICFFPE
jgi:tetratricopeptide (TPR) repeat protein